MRAVINKLIEQEQDRAVYNFKRDNDIVRLKKGQKETILKELEKDKQMKEYRKIYKELGSWA